MYRSYYVPVQTNMYVVMCLNQRYIAPLINHWKLEGIWIYLSNQSNFRRIILFWVNQLTRSYVSKPLQLHSGLGSFRLSGCRFLGKPPQLHFETAFRYGISVSMSRLQIRKQARLLYHGSSRLLSKGQGTGLYGVSTHSTGNYWIRYTLLMIKLANIPSNIIELSCQYDIWINFFLLYLN